ncbi:hypothetical protein AB0K48_30405 [Nonomuraea sp. NPDC055795]|uniref:hypothetical protein n=1 Tax=Nonomuraea endophytica TaxID=714136 RepID=UPI0034781B34
MCWAFEFDDHYSDTGPHSARPDRLIPMVCRMLARLEHPELPADGDGNAFTAPLLDIAHRLDAAMGAEPARR